MTSKDQETIELELINILSTFSTSSKTHQEETKKSIENAWDYYNCLFDNIDFLKKIFTKSCKDFFPGTNFVWYIEIANPVQVIPLDPSPDSLCNQLETLQISPELIQSPPEFFQPGRISYTSRYVYPIRLNNFSIPEVLLIKSYMGTGKTAALIQYLKKAFHDNPTLRVLILSPRQLFSENIQSEFNMHSLNFQNYLSFTGEDRFELSRFNRLIIQMESLYRLQKITYEDSDDPYEITPEVIEPYDIIILDESESCLKQFTSQETMGENLEINSKIFSYICKGSKKIIALDAFLSERTEKTLNSLLPNFIFRYEENTYIPEKRSATEFKSQKRLFEYILNELKSNKKLFCMFSSKKKGEKLNEYLNESLPASRIKFYCGKENYSDSLIQRQDLKDVRRNWQNYDCIISTSVVTVGINFDILNYFSSIVIYGSNFTCSPRDVFQNSLRVRHLIENKLVFCLQTRYDSNVAEEKNKEIDLALKKFCGQEVPSWLRICHSYNIQEDYDTFFNYRNVFMEYLTLCNYVLG